MSSAHVREDRDKPYSSGIIRDVSNTTFISEGQLTDNGDGTWTRELWLNVYYPTEEVRQLLPDPEKLPVILAVYGGGLQSGNRDRPTTVALAKRFAQRGYVALTLDYMLKPHDVDVGDDYYVSQAMRESVDALEYERGGRIMEATRRNLAACISWINTNAANYHMDVDKLAVIGSSAGSLIMLDMFLDQDYIKHSHVSPFVTDDLGTLRYTAPKALVSLWGYLSRTGENTLGVRPGFGEFAADADTDPNPAIPLEDLLAKSGIRPFHTSDQDILDAKDPPVFFHHSTGDPTIPYLQSAYLNSRLRALGVESQLDLLISAPKGKDGYVAHDNFNKFYSEGHFDRALRFLYAKLISVEEIRLSGLVGTQIMADKAGTPLHEGKLVLWLVDRQGGGNFSELDAAGSFMLPTGSTLAVGNQFGAYEIVGYQASDGSGLIGSDLTIQTVNSPLDPDSTISMGDQVGVVWFPSLAYDPSGSSLISTTENGLTFGFLTQPEPGSGHWTLPGTTSTITFNMTPGMAEFQQFTNQAPGKLLEVDKGTAVSYEAWALANFPGSADPLMIGAEADPDGSGLPNLLRYAFNLSREESPAGLQPYPLPGSGLPRFAIPYSPGKTDVVFIGEASEDLLTWPHEIFNSTTTTLEPVDGWIEIPTDGLSIEGPSLFFRLRVDQR